MVKSHTLEVVPPSPALDRHIRNSTDNNAWDFHNGDPEIFMYKDLLVEPGQRVLDLGSGALRASAFFALQGMEVVAVDSHRPALDEANELAAIYNLPIRTQYEDMEAFCLNDISDPYHVVMMAQSTEHTESRTRALKLAQLGYDRVAAGGYFWFRAATILDSRYDALNNIGAPKPEETTYEAPCSCSGTKRIEPVTFLYPLDIHTLLAENGARFIHSQVLPTDGEVNIMNGEDFNPQVSVKTGGLISVLAQKPENKSYSESS